MALPADRDYGNLTGAEMNALNDENVKKLVRNLADPKTSQRELRKMERLALKIIAKHRWNWSPSGKDVKRTLDELVERLRIEGMSTFGNTIREMANKFLALPEIQQNQNPDVGWTVLDFLLLMSNDPIQNIRRNRVEMNHRRMSMIASADEAARRKREAAVCQTPINSFETDVDWTALLSEDFLDSPEDESSEDLSDWSDESDYDSSSTLRPEENEGTSRSLTDMATVYEQAMLVAAPIESGNTSYLPPVHEDRGIKPNVFKITQPLALTLIYYKDSPLRLSRLIQLDAPKLPAIATEYKKSDRNTNVLERTIHTYWWRDAVKVYALPSGENPIDNFAVSYLQFLNHSSGGLLNLPLPKTSTESCLLREILFMFARPTNCCFFELDTQTRRISVRNNVAICTMTASALQSLLQHIIVPALEDMMKLRRFIDVHTLHYGGNCPVGTVECFAYALRDLIQPIRQLLIDYEEHVVRDPARNTLINFMLKFKEHFCQLQLLRSLAEDVILDIGPPHVRSAYLLSRLYKHTLPHLPRQKLATGLLLVSLKRYCNILDGWWRKATLEDHLNEFIVERWVDGDTDRRSYVRKRCLDPNESLEVVGIFRKLHSCPIYKVLLEHALESGETQDLLANVNLLGEMLTTSNETQRPSLYDELTTTVFSHLKVYCSSLSMDDVEAADLEEDMLLAADKRLANNVQGIRNLNFFVKFTNPVQQRLLDRRRERGTKKPIQLLNILRRLDRSTCLQIKSEIPEALQEILQRRQCLANEYAMRAYRKELEMGEILRFLRHTMMLEAYYILLPYYNALFSRIEKTVNWAQGSVLNSKLNKVLFPQYPHLANNLQVKIISKVFCTSSKVYEALEALELVYDMPVGMQRILTDRHMKDYNAVWRLMLKLKWAVWKLENLAFLRRRNTKPYEPLDLLGLTIRRLEILRFWLIYLINSLHTHIMQALGQQFELQIGKCMNIRQLRTLHDEYLSLLKTHCLLTGEFDAFRIALDQLFHLVFVLDMEWSTCASYLGENDALSLDITFSDDSKSDSDTDARGMEYLALNQVLEIEMTYIRCHQTLAEILSSLVYKHDHGFLTALEVAISTSVPC